MPECLIVVDVQNDFVTGGRLEVPSGEDVIPVIQRLFPYFDLAVGSRDWHPENHVSFAANHPGGEVGQTIEAEGLEQILWPVHCVQGTSGAEFAAGISRADFDLVIDKGQDPRVDSYSAFFDNGRRNETPLREYLLQRKVSAVHICGLATNVCVHATALDACDLGYETYVILDACRGVDLQPGDVDRAVDEMAQAGAGLIESADIIDQ